MKHVYGHETTNEMGRATGSNEEGTKIPLNSCETTPKKVPPTKSGDKEQCMSYETRI